MQKLNDIDVQILLSVIQGQRQESLQHRQTIFNSFSLSMAGLMVILGGITSANSMPYEYKLAIAVAVAFICCSVTYFISTQRSESEKGMEIIKKIEYQLGLYERNKYLQDGPVLPDEFIVERKKIMGLAKGDIYHAGALFILEVIIMVALYAKG